MPRRSHDGKRPARFQGALLPLLAVSIYACSNAPSALNAPDEARTETTEQAQVAPPPTLDTVVQRFSPYDKDGDGTDEIEHLSLASFDQPVPNPRAGSVLVFLEERLMTGANAGDLTQRLVQWRDDLVHEGYDPRFVTARVYGGPVDQDGFTLLAMRDFVKSAARSLPSFKGIVLVGSFPEATLMLTWMKRLDNATMEIGGATRTNVSVLRRKVDRINPRSDVVLGDLDGNWDAVYRRGDTTLTQWDLVPALPLFPPTLWPTQGQTLSGTTYNYSTLTWHDYFDLDEESTTAAVQTAPAGDTLTVTVGSLARHDTEVSSAERAVPNALAIPEVAVSRIDALHVALRPWAPFDMFGHQPIGSDGKPQALTYAGAASIHWVRDADLEAQLLLDYFDRNHAFRGTGGTRPPKRASAVCEANSKLTPSRQLDDFAMQAGDGFAPAVAMDNADLQTYVDWLKQPALYRGVAVHGTADTQSVYFPTPLDARAFEASIGGPPWAWKVSVSAGLTSFTPGLPALSDGGGSSLAGFELNRAIWENHILDHTLGSIWFHEACDLAVPDDALSPGSTSTVPYSDPRYGGRQDAESILFYLDAVALFGRGKVFYDLPVGAPPAIKAHRRVGEGWRGIFTNDAATVNPDVLSRKRAYYWTLFGDVTLAPEPDTTAPTFDLVPGPTTSTTAEYTIANAQPQGDLVQVSYYLDETPGHSGTEALLGVVSSPPFTMDVDRSSRSEGTYYLDAVGCDEWDNCTTREASFVIDRTFPVVDRTGLTTTAVANTYAVKLTIDAHDNLGVARVAWTLSKPGGPSISAAHDLSPSQLAYGGTDVVALPVGSTSGNYDLTIELTDIGGNRITDHRTMLVDLAPPNVQASPVVTIGTVGGLRSLSFQPVVQDDVGLVRVAWTLSIPYTSTVVASKDHTLNPMVTPYYATDVLVVPSTFSTGYYWAEVDAVDYGGHTGKWAGQVLVYDTDPPAPPPPSPCGRQFTADGGNAGGDYVIDVGATSGHVVLDYNTETNPDIITMTCADSGGLSYSTGCVSTPNPSGQEATTFFSCTSSSIRVHVTPDCADTGDTLWSFTLHCATP